MSQKSEQNGIPNWLLFLFFGTLVFGGLYGIFAHGFLKADSELSYRNSANLKYEKASATEPVFSSFPAHNAETIQKGQDHYKAACAACHAADMTGTVGPNLIDAEWLNVPVPTEKNVAIRVIKGVSADQAKKGGVMPPRGGSSLSNDEILTIAYFLASKNPTIKKSEK